MAQSGTSQHLNSVSFVNRGAGIAVGDKGTVLRTTNAGTTWFTEFSGTTKDLYAVSFGSANRGIVVGDRGTILCASSSDIAASINEQKTTSTPLECSLAQNYPNPFNAMTTLRYDVPATGRVSLSVFNLLGQRVTTLFDGRQLAGSHTVVWDASNLPSGIYLCRMEAPGFAQTRKMLLVK